MKIVKQIDYPSDNKTLSISVDENNNPWLTKTQITELYGMDKSWISRRVDVVLKYLEKTSVLAKNESVVAKYATTGSDGKTYKMNHYSIEILYALDTKFSVNTGHQLKEYIDSQIRNEILANNGEVIIYNNDNSEIEVTFSPEEDTVWMNQNQMAKLYGVTQPNISVHLQNIYEDEEADFGSTHKFYLLVQNEGGRDVKRQVDYYNLDVILNIGYRVRSKTASAFRKWVTSLIKQYCLKGYAYNPNKYQLSEQHIDNLDYRVELLEKRVDTIEKKSSHLFVEEKMIMDGTVFDASVLMYKLISTAKRQVILIDPYVNILTLNHFKELNKDVELIFITSFEKLRLSEIDINHFKEQYHDFTLYQDEKIHDRYLILDTEIFYHLGTSPNQIGTNESRVSFVEKKEDVLYLKNRYLKVI